MSLKCRDKGHKNLFEFFSAVERCNRNLIPSTNTKECFKIHTFILDIPIRVCFIVYGTVTSKRNYNSKFNRTGYKRSAIIFFKMLIIDDQNNPAAEEII